MKIITRLYYDDQTKELKEGKFYNSGIWGNGHLAFSRLDENNNVIEEDDGMYVQVRYAHKLIMFHI